MAFQFVLCGVSAKEVMLEKVPMWVRFYDMSYNWMIEKKIIAIVGIIGELLTVSLNDRNGTCARARVSLNLDNPLLSRWWL